MTSAPAILPHDTPEAFLARIDADWARHVARTGPCGHATKPAREPYEALIRAVAYQQLHVRAGDAILARLLALYGGAFPTPAQLLDTDPALQRQCGYSARKIDTLRDIAAAAQDGTVPTLQEARGLADEALIERLVTLKGVGRWTVEMFLIYTLERADVLPVDDFGVRNGYRVLKGLERLPTPREMRLIGQAWSPHRTAAAWYLWRVPAG